MLIRKETEQQDMPVDVLSSIDKSLKKLVYMQEQQFKAAGQPVRYPQKETTTQQKEGE